VRSLVARKIRTKPWLKNEQIQASKTRLCSLLYCTVQYLTPGVIPFSDFGRYFVIMTYEAGEAGETEWFTFSFSFSASED
jgi:hypothetical protein